MHLWLTSSTVLFPLVLLSHQQQSTEALGGELATLTLTPFSTDVNDRQNFCDRYREVIDSNGTQLIQDALRGVEIHPVLQYGSAFPYFNYDPVTGIDKENPGLVADLLDYIADHAGFTWRDSFAVYTNDDKGDNKTWSQMLTWTSNTYDISIDKWAQSTERLNLGISFCDPWFDASLIMIDKLEPPEKNNKVKFGNWLSPFETSVWVVTIFTILFSCFVYQFLEWLAGEREDRSWRQWFMDNLYLSSINFTQNYTYEPTHLAGRVFGVSFAFWTMLIGATYTANLASLLVERERPPLKIANIDEGIQRGFKMCTFRNSFSDSYIQREYGGAIRVAQPSPADMYDAVEAEECEILIGTRQAWLGFADLEEYNPTCQLEWVGRQVLQVDAAFATKVDPGVQCTGIVNEVFNFYLSKMRDEGFFDDKWSEFNTRLQDPNFSCNVNAGSSGADEARARKLSEESKERNLKGTSGNAAAASDEDGEGEGEESLTLRQMAGTFLLHLCGSFLAIIVGLLSYFFEKKKKREKDYFPGSARTLGQSQDQAEHSSGSSTGTPAGTSVQSQLEAVQSSQVELSNQLATIMSRLNSIQQQLDPQPVGY